MAAKKKTSKRKAPARKRKASTRRKKKATGKSKSKPEPKPKAQPKSRAGIGGRITLLTPTVQEVICDYLREGNYIETAAAAVGVNQSTVRRWMARGRREIQRLSIEPHTGPKEEELPYLEFCEATDKALAQSEIEGLQLLRSHAYEDWKSIAWRLERRFFERWGNRKAIEHSGPGGEPVKVQRIKIGDEYIEF